MVGKGIETDQDAALKGSGYQLKGSGYQRKGSGYQRKGSGYQLKGSGYQRKGIETDQDAAVDETKDVCFCQRCVLQQVLLRNP